jgi:phosphoglycolate phosphatase
MPGRHRLIMFDFDGTLVDSGRAIAVAMAEAFVDAGLPPPTGDEVRRVVGLHLEEAVARLLDEEARALVPGIAAAYRESFMRLRMQPDFDEPLVDGARQALERLDGEGALLGIVTGKNRRGLLASLERHALGTYFITLKTADDGPGKPHPQVLLEAMAEIGTDPGETVVIGDTVYDMEMAANARAHALGVDWGYHESDELLRAGAHRVLTDFAQLRPALADLEAET